MPQPYIGEIRLFAGAFAPAGWAYCDGSQMPISEYDTLFQLIGTTYGGDGQSTFNLPDLRGRVPVHQGPGYGIGQLGGVPSVTLTIATMPNHPHPFAGSANTANSAPLQNQVMASPADVNTLPYGTDAPIIPMLAAAVLPVGGSQSHENMQPYLCISFIISLYGTFPPPS